MSDARKILVSPGWGAGWSSWADGDAAKVMLTYQPIIDFLEAGGDAADLTGEWVFAKGGDQKGTFHGHPLLMKLAAELSGYEYFGGAYQLEVWVVHGEVKVEEYDGNESVIERGDDEGWM